MVNNHFSTAVYYTIYKYTSCIDLTVSNLHEQRVKIISLKMAGIGRNQRGRPGWTGCSVEECSPAWNITKSRPYTRQRCMLLE